MTENTSFNPDWVSPPGETIEDLLRERGWTEAELAGRMGCTVRHISALVRGHVRITAETAGCLARVLGSTADFWLTREAQCRKTSHGL